MHPFYEQKGARAVSGRLLASFPTKRSLRSSAGKTSSWRAQRRRRRGGEWVCSMGHSMGLFDQILAWHPAERQDGVPALLRVSLRRRTGRSSRPPYSATSSAFCSRPASPPRPAVRRVILTPGPRTHDGLSFTISVEPAAGPEDHGAHRPDGSRTHYSEWVRRRTNCSAPGTRT